MVESSQIFLWRLDYQPLRLCGGILCGCAAVVRHNLAVMILDYKKLTETGGVVVSVSVSDVVMPVGVGHVFLLPRRGIIR